MQSLRARKGGAGLQVYKLWFMSFRAICRHRCIILPILSCGLLQPGKRIGLHKLRRGQVRRGYRLLELLGVWDGNLCFQFRGRCVLSMRGGHIQFRKRVNLCQLRGGEVRPHWLIKLLGVRHGDVCHELWAIKLYELQPRYVPGRPRANEVHHMCRWPVRRVGLDGLP